MNFLVWEMSLLPFLAVIKEVAVGGAISGIMYNELLKEIMTARGLTHTQHVASTSMAGLIIHHKHLEV